MVRKIKKYEKIIINWLTAYAAERTKTQVEYQIISDTLHHHYQVVKTAWISDVFKHTVIFHFCIKEDAKVWLFVNNTDILVTEELIEMGIPKNEIVIGFQSPHIRQFSGYATA
jgi:XisI protein